MNENKKEKFNAEFVMHIKMSHIQPSVGICLLVTSDCM